MTKKNLAHLETFVDISRQFQPLFPLTLGADEVDDLAVVLEHVHLFDGRDVGYTNPLEGRCELLVICNSDRSQHPVVNDQNSTGRTSKRTNKSNIATARLELNTLLPPRQRRERAATPIGKHTNIEPAGGESGRKR